VLIFGHDRAIARWVGDHLGVDDFGPCVAIGVAHKDKLVAGWVYNNYRHPSIEISFVRSSPNWASPGAVRAIFRYPFIQLRCKRLTATVEATNQPVRAFLCRLGFRQEGHHPDALPSGDAVTYGILAREAVRWTAEESPDGKINTDAAPGTRSHASCESAAGNECRDRDCAVGTQ
jgi:RimJ/RimL family protein N-acetyltransferase